jgi:hypothetical protein
MKSKNKNDKYTLNREIKIKITFHGQKTSLLYKNTQYIYIYIYIYCH